MYFLNLGVKGLNIKNLYTDDATNYSFPFSSPESKPENLTIHYT